jgi:hypothetical protein
MLIRTVLIMDAVAVACVYLAEMSQSAQGSLIRRVDPSVDGDYFTGSTEDIHASQQ